MDACAPRLKPAVRPLWGVRMNHLEQPAPVGDHGTAWAALYQAASQQWAHAEQIRWTLLYNYLMASTILLLAWAAVFASQDMSTSRSAVLVTLSLGGVALSAVWVALGARATSFVQRYREAGQALEAALVREAGITPPATPFVVAHEHRCKVEGVARFAPSWFVLWGVPTVFLVLYLVLCFVSLFGGALHTATISVVLFVLLAAVSVAFVVKALSDLSPKKKSTGLS